MCDFVRSLDIAAKLMRQYWVQVNTSKFNQNEFRLSETLIWASMYIRHTKGWTDRQTLTYLLITPWKRVLLEKVTGSQLVKKFPAFYGSRRFITAFTSVRHLSLSWATSIQSMPSHPTFWRSILILSSHQRQGIDTYFHLNACMCTQSYKTEFLLIHINVNFFSQHGSLYCITDIWV